MMIRRLALAALLALAPCAASAQFATIGATPPVTDNNDRLATTGWVNNFFALGIPLATGKIFIGSAGGIAAQQTMSGDCTLAASGVITCTQSAGNFLVNGTLTVSGAVIDGSGILATNIAAPATPATGTTRIYVDSSTKVLTFKNDAGTVGNAVVPSSASAHQWASAIGAAGVVTYTQPSFSDLSGSAVCAQEPARTGDVTATAGSCVNLAVKLNGVAFAASPSTDTVPVITAANTATYTAMPNCTSGVLQYTTSTHLFNCGVTGVSSLNSATGAINFSIVTQVFASSGTYTPTVGMVYAVITCYGAGAGGGGAPSSSTGFASGGGGGAGSKSIKSASAATIGSSQTVTIGAGGAGGAAGFNNGVAGSDTSVGTLCIGKGGLGGLGAPSGTSGGGGGAGGVAGTGDTTGTGQPGSTGIGAAITTVGAYVNAGGSTDIGGGGPAPVQTTGIAASGPGGGGSGGNTFSTAVAGGAGFKGYVRIEEFVIH